MNSMKAPNSEALLFQQKLIGTKWKQEWDRSGNKNPKVGQEWEQSGNKKGNTVGSKSGTRMGTKWEQKWDQSGNKNPKVGQE